MEQEVKKNMKNWDEDNRALYKAYLAAITKKEESEIENQFLQSNMLMFYRKAASIPVKQYGAMVDKEDVLQTVQLEYLEALKRAKAQGQKSYRLDLFKIAENAAKETLSNSCGAGGVKIPYGVKKRKAKDGTLNMPVMVAVNSCDEGDDATGIEKRKAAMMSDGTSAEDVVINMIAHEIVQEGVREALLSLDKELRDVVIMRYMQEGKRGMKWTEIGKTQSLSEGAARHRCARAIEQLKKECIQRELDTYLY